MAGLKSNPVVKKLMESGEAGISRIVQQVVANEKFVARIQTVVATTLQAKGMFDKNIRVALSAMNLPSSGDLEQIRNKVSDLEAQLAQIDDKLTQVLDSK